MLIEILNKRFQTIYILEKYESFIWTDRFNEYGDFEIEIPMEKEAFDKWIQIGNYVRNSESDRLMIIEQYKVFTDEEEGDHVQISGRSLEAILERRVIMGNTLMDDKNGAKVLELDWEPVKFEDMPFSTVVERLVRNSFIDTVPERIIDNLAVDPVTEGVMYETLLTMDFDHDNLYDKIKDLCQTYWYGFKMTLQPWNHYKISEGTMRRLNTSGKWDANKYTQNGVTFEVNRDGSIKVSGTANSSGASFYISVGDRDSMQTGETYRITGCPAGGSTNTYMIQYSNWGVGTSQVKYDVGSGVNVTKITDSPVQRSRIWIKAGYTANNLIFRPTMLNSENRADHFVFQLYSGLDRSYRQSRRPYVAFAPTLDNLLNSEYTNSEIGVLNAAYCAGDDIGGEKDEDGNETEKMMLHVQLGSTTGLDRRETYESVSGVNAESENAMGQVQMAGRIKLRESKAVCGFEGQADIMRGFLAYKDYFIGDIVEVIDRYGFHAPCYITEIIISHDSDGLQIYPTFEYRDDLLRDYMEPKYLIKDGSIVSGSGLVNSTSSDQHGYTFEWSEDISMKLKYGTTSVNRNTGSGADLYVQEVYKGPGAWGCIGSDKKMDLRNYSTLHVEFGEVDLDFWNYRAFWQSTNIHISAAQEKKCGYTGFTRTICQNPTIFNWDESVALNFQQYFGTAYTWGGVDENHYYDVTGYYTKIAVRPGDTFKITGSSFDNEECPGAFVTTDEIIYDDDDDDEGGSRKNYQVLVNGERKGFKDELIVIPRISNDTIWLYVNSYDSDRYPLKILRPADEVRKHSYSLDVSDIDSAYISVALYTWLQDKNNTYPAMHVKIENMYLT